MRYASGLKRTKRFNFIVFVSHVNKIDGTSKAGTPVPIRDRRQLAEHLKRIALKGHWVTHFEVMTWEEAKKQGRNPWA